MNTRGGESCCTHHSNVAAIAFVPLISGLSNSKPVCIRQDAANKPLRGVSLDKRRMLNEKLCAYSSMNASTLSDSNQGKVNGMPVQPAQKLARIARQAESQTCGLLVPRGAKGLPAYRVSPRNHT